MNLYDHDQFTEKKKIKANNIDNNKLSTLEKRDCG